MENNINLMNAVIVGENPEGSFIVEGSRLHAVDRRVAALEKDKSNPKLIIPLMREGLKALITHATGKIESHFLDVNWKIITDQPKEQEQLKDKIEHIYTHLSHHDRNELSSLVHHRQTKK
ncbi:MAG: hypothetical protein H0W88_05245 [Parachlamydiaceae bacterium]|nr:hypothetical protein [Parachlamydiaceae bacterium]